VTDWHPDLPWVVVEGCPCEDFFVWSSLVDARLPSLSAKDRGKLAVRIMSLRSTNREAWLTTADGTVDGTLVVRSARPERSA
jgi:hypothetical protein